MIVLIIIKRQWIIIDESKLNEIEEQLSSSGDYLVQSSLLWHLYDVVVFAVGARTLTAAIAVIAAMFHKVLLPVAVKQEQRPPRNVNTHHQHHHHHDLRYLVRLHLPIVRIRILMMIRR